MNSSGTCVLLCLGLGLVIQIPEIRDTYRIATVFTLVVGVTGAASFTFTVSPLTFLGFCLPFTFPVFFWLWLSSPGASGQILAVMVIPYFTSIFFLVMREHRGQLTAKNKGEIDMYFLNGIKPELSVNGEGRVPSEEFRARYKKRMRRRS